MTDPLELITAGLAVLAERDAHEMPDDTLLTSTEALFKVVDRIHGVISTQLQAMHVRDVTTAARGRKTRSWLIEDLHLGHEAANRHMTVAKALPSCPTVAAALLDGVISLEHARNIVTSVKKTPAEIREVFEKELVTAATHVDPTALGSFARELRSRLGDPETSEQAEQRKYDDRWITLTPTFQGMHRLDGMLDPHSAATLLAAINPLTRDAGQIDDRTIGQRRADALVSIAARVLRSGTLPAIGGEHPHLVITVPYDQLKAELDSIGDALLNGLPISPTTARMLGCDAGIIPALLGANGEVLDLGRKQPVWSLAQRRALQLEDHGCRFPGCQTGLEHCQIHHQKHWAHGGKTDLRNGIHLCDYHHWQTHHGGWHIHKDRHNKIHVWRT